MGLSSGCSSQGKLHNAILALQIRRCLYALLLIISFGHHLSAQAHAAADHPPVLDLVKDAVRFELQLIDYDHSYLRYKVQIHDSKGEQMRDVIESKDGTVARLISRGGSPLSSEDDQAERERLQAMLDSPSTFRKHIDKDRSGKHLAIDLIKLLPDAMNFNYVDGQSQTNGSSAGTTSDWVLDFEPKPGWNPPTMTAQALQGIRGRVWVDRNTHHLTRLEASVFQGVNFGYGVLAHIYPGGKLFLQQQPVGPDRWIVNHFVEDVTVRAVMFKTIHESTDLQAGDFNLIPAMNYQDAIHLLMQGPPNH